MIAQAFFDDTGAHQKDVGLFRWVGLMATHAVWGRFHPAWCNVLNADPPTRYWHTVSAHTGKLMTTNGSPLERGAREAKEARLAELLSSFGEEIVSVEISLDLAEHQRFVVGMIKTTPEELAIAPGLLTFLEHPACLAMRRAIIETQTGVRVWAKRVKESEDEPKLTWIIFEDREDAWQDELCFTMQILRKTMDQEQRKRVGPVLSLPGKGRGGGTPLEAADLFAWHVNRLGPAGDGKAEPGWEHLSKIPRNQIRIKPEFLMSYVESLNKKKGKLDWV